MEKEEKSGRKREGEENKGKGKEWGEEEGRQIQRTSERKRGEDRVVQGSSWRASPLLQLYFAWLVLALEPLVDDGNVGSCFRRFQGAQIESGAVGQGEICHRPGMPGAGGGVFAGAINDEKIAVDDRCGIDEHRIVLARLRKIDLGLLDPEVLDIVHLGRGRKYHSVVFVSYATGTTWG